MSPDRLRELAQAKKEGRLVVLPRLHGKKVEVFSIREAAEAALKEREAIQNVLDKQDKG